VVGPIAAAERLELGLRLLRGDARGQAAEDADGVAGRAEPQQLPDASLGRQG
jgi:hypothetical protein